MHLTQIRLKEVLNYCPKTGIFTWRTTRPGCAASSVAGNTNPNGYVRIGIDYKSCKASRLAWLYCKGQLPPVVDHLDGNRSNNRLANLRAATHAENSQNTTLVRGSASKLVGVTPHRGKWQAQINVDGRYTYLGLFDSVRQAHAAYLAAKKKLHRFQPVPRDYVGNI